MKLTDEQCDSFRRHPGSFNDIIRAVYAAGAKSAGKLYTEEEMKDFMNYGANRFEFTTTAELFEMWKKRKENP